MCDVCHAWNAKDKDSTSCRKVIKLNLSVALQVQVRVQHKNFLRYGFKLRLRPLQAKQGDETRCMRRVPPARFLRALRDDSDPSSNSSAEVVVRNKKFIEVEWLTRIESKQQ